MSLKFARGIYKVKNTEKYVGSKAPMYRSGWELVFCRLCDNNPAVLEWASEPIKIPYRDPLTGRHTVYVPDFLVLYVDRNQKKHLELIEIKPAKQTLRERVGKNPYDQAQFVKNQVKWAAAMNWCKNKNIFFRVINEDNIFDGVSSKK